MQWRSRRRPAPIRLDAVATLDEGAWRAVLAGEPAQAARWLEAAARYGLVEAQTLFGQVLLQGRGVPRDAPRAARWFRIAADAGHVPAMNMTGRCLELGWGVARDWPAAAAWYRRAADAAHDWAQYNLANMLLRGRGVARDRRQALRWFLLASSQGHAKSMNLVGRFLEEGWEVPRDRAAAAAWYRRAAEGGDFRAQFNLATLLAQQGALEAAHDWLRRAAGCGTAEFLDAMELWLAQRAPPSLQTLMAVVGTRRAALRDAVRPPHP